MAAAGCMGFFPPKDMGADAAFLRNTGADAAFRCQQSAFFNLRQSMFLRALHNLIEPFVLKIYEPNRIDSRNVLKHFVEYNAIVGILK